MKYRSYTAISFKKTQYFEMLPMEERRTFEILTKVFHFKVNNYVLENLINWKDIPNDPIYKMVFLRKEMASIPGLFTSGIPSIINLFLKRSSKTTSKS